jgi:hypothetical protein
MSTPRNQGRVVAACQFVWMSVLNGASDPDELMGHLLT